MKKFISTVLFFGLIPQSFAKTNVEFVGNRTHALLIFVQAIAGSRRLPEHLRKVFADSKYNNDKSKIEIENFNKLDTAFERSIAVEGGVKERYNDLAIKDIVVIQSAFAKDLNDYRERLSGIMTYDELSKFIDVLTYFNPIYEELIWKKNYKELLPLVESFKTNSKKWKMDELFSKAVKFYNSSWPEQQKFRVSIYPIPKGTRHSNATSIGSIESVGIIIGDNRFEGHFGVVFHELCHSLYSAQSTEVQKQWSDWFLNNSSPYAPLAYQLINESLATVLGNGWAYEKSKGKMDKKEWYNDKKINAFAQALYPKVLEYVNADRSVDKSFINDSIQIFEKTFPQALMEFDSLLVNYILQTDGTMDAREVRSALHKNFYSQSIVAGSPIDHEHSKETIRGNRLATLFFVADQKNKKQIFAMEDFLPGITKIVKGSKSDQNQFGFFIINNRRVYILLLANADKINNAVDWMVKTQKLEKQQEFIPLAL